MNGEKALATGWDLVLPNDDARMSWDEHNKTRDYAAGYQRNTMPPRLEAFFRRSDGQLVLNAGDTLMRWEGTPTDTIGGSALSGPSGATYVLPAGVYMISATLRVAVSVPNYSQLILDTGGATTLSMSAYEFQTPAGFYEMENTQVVHVAESANIAVRTKSNNAGTMRINGRFRIFKM